VNKPRPNRLQRRAAPAACAATKRFVCAFAHTERARDPAAERHRYLLTPAKSSKQFAIVGATPETAL
jgi:hypothetical protein